MGIGLGHNHEIQERAAGECGGGDAGQAVRKIDGIQILTVVEHLIGNGGDAAGDRHLGQRVTAVEGVCADGRDGIGE